MKQNSARQTEYHKKMVKAGYKKRSFYVTDETLKAIKDYQEKHGYENIHDALNNLVK